MALVLFDFPAAIGEFVQGTGVTAGRADFPAGKTVFAGLDAEEASAGACPAADDDNDDDDAAAASAPAGDDADVASAGADDNSPVGASPAAAGEGAAAC